MWPPSTQALFMTKWKDVNVICLSISGKGTCIICIMIPLQFLFLPTSLKLKKMCLKTRDYNWRISCKKSVLINHFLGQFSFFAELANLVIQRVSFGKLRFLLTLFLKNWAQINKKNNYYEQCYMCKKQVSPPKISFIRQKMKFDPKNHIYPFFAYLFWFFYSFLQINGSP